MTGDSRRASAAVEKWAAAKVADLVRSAALLGAAELQEVARVAALKAAAVRR